MNKNINDIDIEKGFDFEDAMKKLDGIASELGKESISLDEALKIKADTLIKEILED